jgi:hypothetical protein
LELGDVGRFEKVNPLARRNPPFTLDDIGLSYWIIRIDGAEEMVVQGRQISRGPNLKPEVSTGRPFVLKGVVTKGLKVGAALDAELKGEFKIVSKRTSKQGTAFFVFEAVREEGKPDGK